jgi:hypothetical protein
MGTKNVTVWIVLFVVTISGVLSYSQVGHSINYEVSTQSEAKSNESIISNTNQNAVLGDLIYEASGKIVGQRVVDTESSNSDLGKIEVSYSGRGYIKGIGNISETWTFENTHLPNSVSQGVGHGIIIPNNGNGVAEATELGRGFLVEPGKIVYPGARFFSADPSGKLAFLIELVGVTEWTVDSSGNYNHKMWQWK